MREQTSITYPKFEFKSPILCLYSIFFHILVEFIFFLICVRLRGRLFPGKWFSRNHFPNFHIFVCHQKSWSTETLSGQRKTLSSQRKIWLGFQERFSFYFGRKTLSRSCEKFRNIILFVDYIKFDPQTFDCYIYIYIFFFFEYLFFNFIP